MCKYYGKTDFGGCYHSVKTEDIDQRLHYRKEYCFAYIQQWAKATINNDTAVSGPNDTVDPADLAFGAINTTAWRVVDTLAPCPFRTYDPSVAILASQDMSAVTATSCSGPVCPACAEKCDELDREWSMFQLLIEKLNVNINHGLYSGDNSLHNGREVPAYLKIMIPMSEERLWRMNDRRSMAFTPDVDSNVFVTQQWDSLRFFQRLLFFDYIRRKRLIEWSTRITRFGRKIDATAWRYLNSQLCVLFDAQNMHHVLPPISDPRLTDAQATIDLDYSVQALAPPRSAAEIAAWDNLHPRVRAEDAIMVPDLNVISMFRPAVSTVLEKVSLNPSLNLNLSLSPSPETNSDKEAPDDLADCICGDDIFLGVEESEEDPSFFSL